MALRIASSPTVAPARRSAPAAASAALSRGDLAAYAAAWRDAAEIEDVHERYSARRQLAELALAEADLPAAALAHRFRAAAEGLIGALEDEPREPILLNYAGVALYELNALAAAQALFEAAERLAPGQTGAHSNLDEIERRRKAGITRLDGVPKTIAAALPPLVERARAAAAKAQPVKNLTLSLCMIVRDEEEALPRCLQAAAPAVDEIIVVDTGSTDRTKEIAASFGAKIIDFPWTGSFAEARNVSFDAATCDWMMFLDADEVLVSDDIPQLRAALGRTWREAFYLTETSYVGALDDGAGVTHNALRVFRNRTQYRFEGAIHEQILHTLPREVAERFESTTVRVEHYGYLGVVRDAKQKSRRNLELLEQQAADGDDTAFLHFNLGSEHLALGDARTASAYFTRAWQKLLESPRGLNFGFAPSLASRKAKALCASGELAETHRFAQEALSHFPGFTDLVFVRSIAAREAGDDDLAAELLHRCLAMGDAPADYSAAMGAGSFLALTALGEIHVDGGRHDEAVALLRRCLAEHPRYLGALDPLAKALLATGASPATLEAEVAAVLGDELPPNAHFVVGMALYEAGQAAAARPHFEAVLERQPHSDIARVALGEAHLSDGDLEAAAAAVAHVGSGGVCSAAARRLEAFCALARGDAEAAKVALGDGATDVSRDDAAVLRAWISVLEGGRPAFLPASAAETLLTTLDVLLRLEAVDAFASLVGLLDATPLPRRQRRERLAGLYLRRGFLESAGDEWLAACEEDGTDADALVGLAQVAMARGFDEDAQVFAEEAALLAPEDERVARLLTHYASSVQVRA